MNNHDPHIPFGAAVEVELITPYSALMTPEDWSVRCRDVLSRYSPSLLRLVAAKLVRPRANQPSEELLEKSLAALGNPPVIDRRIRDLPESSRKLLTLIGLSRQPRWKVTHLLTLLSALGHNEGFLPVETALAAGLLYPELPPHGPPVNDFVGWFCGMPPLMAEVFALPAVAARAKGEPLGLPDLASPELVPAKGQASRVADGLDWPLRLASVWQQVLGGPVRLTQANTVFKKDLTRLQADELLATPPADAAGIADAGVLALLWAAAAGLLILREGELSAIAFPESWEAGLTSVLLDFFAALPRVESWDPLTGYSPSDTALSSLPTVGFLTLLLLASGGETTNGWLHPGPVANWLWTHHPSWGGTLPPEGVKDRGEGWVTAFLLGVAFSLQLVETAEGLVRLSPLGRHLLLAEAEPTLPPIHPQTLLVQPNAEILAFRQGLNPALIGTLSRFARWKGLGPACTLELTPEHTYRGLESGLTLPMILQTLARHSTRPMPPVVADLLNRWASKRERITVFTSAVLVEFATPADLETAIARGIVVLRLTDRIGMTADGTEPGLAQLRLIANRDYEAKPQRCLTSEEDGITLTVDAAAADLLLDAEVGRFAVPLPIELPGVRRFRLNAELLRRSAASILLTDIDAWFTERTGQPLSPAGRLLLLSPQSPPPSVSRLLVVRFATAELAEGAMQWPETRALIAERLGPTAVVVSEENLEALRTVLAELRLPLRTGG